LSGSADVQTWTEYAVHVCTGAGEWVEIPIVGPEPEHVGQYARKPEGNGSYRPVPDMDALRVRTVRATEWRRPSTITLDALKRKAGES
jgi:hypothetical protein